MALAKLRPETPDRMEWPRQYLELAALAQHHGVPTRLLDFSSTAVAAAYFAAQSVENPRSRNLAVWAIDATVLGYGEHCDGIWFELVRATRSSNPNLHAQAGLFAVWSGPDHIVPLDEIIKRLARGNIKLSSGSLKIGRPAIRKFLLPRKCRPDLLGLLVHERVTGATMFPGVDGVVRSLKEEAIHRRFSNDV